MKIWTLLYFFLKVYGDNFGNYNKLIKLQKKQGCRPIVLDCY